MLSRAHFADLPKLLALAAHDNVAVKISDACTLSREPFPYKDLWDPLGRVFDAFSFDRGPAVTLAQGGTLCLIS
jgi:L-fuconolactonase